MKMLNRIMAWLKKEPGQVAKAGPVFRPIMKGITSGTKIKGKNINR